MKQTTPTRKTKSPSSDPLDDATQLALNLGEFFRNQKTRAGEPVSDGLVYAAMGLLLGSKAQTTDQCNEISRALVVAITSAYRMKPPK